MGFQLIKIAAAASLFVLGACTTMTTESSVSNIEVDEDASTVMGYDVSEGDGVVANAQKSNSKVDDDNIVCKRMQITGSKFQKKVCMTWGEWKARQEASKALAIENNRRMYQQGNPQGG